jgi:hypothetical protein
MIGAVKFTATKQEAEFIRTIVERVLSRHLPSTMDKQSVLMDLEACHSNGCPLRLKEMAAWERDFDLVHDVCGIVNTIDRTTGKLTGHFLPRFAVRQ